MKKPNRVRYFVCKGNSFYWQPSRRLRIAGWEPVKLPDNLRQARDKAEELNEKLDKWYLGFEDALPQPEVIKTLDKLIDRYMDDISYTRLKPKTRHGYDSRLKKLKEWGAGVPVSAITPLAVNELYNTLERKKSLHEANAVVTVLHIILEFAIRPLGWIKENPSDKLGRKATPPRDRIGSKEEEEALINACLKLNLKSIAKTVVLGTNIGQRQADILAITGKEYVNGRFRIKQQKTNRWVSVPATNKVREFIGDVRLRDDEYLITTDKTGQPYSEAYFRHKFIEVRKEAAKICPSVKTLQFLDLRRTAVVRMGEAGCTESQIAAVTGHKIDTCRRILETYLPRTDKMADEAINKLERYNFILEEAA